VNVTFQANTILVTVIVEQADDVCSTQNKL